MVAQTVTAHDNDSFYYDEKLTRHWTVMRMMKLFRRASFLGRRWNFFAYHLRLA